MPNHSQRVSPHSGGTHNPHTHIMTDENKKDVKSSSLVRYVVITTDGYWGKDSDLLVALKNAKVNTFYALNSKKRGNLAHIYRVELDPVESVWNDETKAELKRCHIRLDGYENGDLIEPWVNDWGQLQAWGAKPAELVIKLQIK